MLRHLALMLALFIGITATVRSDDPPATEEQKKKQIEDLKKKIAEFEKKLADLTLAYARAQHGLGIPKAMTDASWGMRSTSLWSSSASVMSWPSISATTWSAAGDGDGAPAAFFDRQAGATRSAATVSVLSAREARVIQRA